MIVGAGAAGLATAIFTRRMNARRDVLLVDGARKPGAKILVSGGGRCNVTNVRVTERDFNGGSRAAVRRVLAALPVAATVAFFEELGITLHEEEHGKLFPDAGRARAVLDALLAEASRLGVERRDAERVTSVERDGDRFAVGTGHGSIAARRVVLATGGLSLPKSGSDGAGMSFAAALGHTIVRPVEALVPLMLDAASAFPFARLAGVSHDVQIAVWAGGKLATRIDGPLLWTHFGASGPAALDASRHWTRGAADGEPIRLTLSFCPGEGFDAVDARLLDAIAARPRATLATLLAALVPAAVADALVTASGVDPRAPAGTLTRDDRRQVAHLLADWELPVTGTRGYNYAEVTAGGVALAEIDPRTMGSRRCPGLHLVGEIVDVDGRLGGFNFQWAWASGFAAGRALARESL